MAAESVQPRYTISNEIHLFGKCGRQENLDVSGLNYPNDPVKCIKSGNGFMVILYSSGKVITIGDNEKGQLGCNDRYPHDGPRQIHLSEDERALVIGCGDRHVFMTTTKNILYAWGRNDMNQLGLQNHIRVQPEPKEIGMCNAIQISGGLFHTLYLSDSGRVYGMGLNMNGQLGLGPYAVNTVTNPMCKITKAVQVASGANHTAVILSDGKLLTFGMNTLGQLGFPNTSKETCYFLPVQVNLPSPAQQVACGSMHTMVLTVSGEVYAFGYNAFGQLGLGNKEDHFFTPQKVVAIDLFNSIKEIQCGFNHTVFLTESGDLYACGWATHGQLGLESTVDRTIPTRVNHTSLQNRYVIGISCGFTHTAVISIPTTVVEQTKKQITVNKEALHLQKFLVEKGTSEDEPLNDLLLCPVCYEFLKVPISQCLNGHLVCGDCRKKLTHQCPICRSHFSNVPTRVVADIINLISKAKKENETSPSIDQLKENKPEDHNNLEAK